ncbi:hypothetical protein [Qipengyuania flava]|uniref:hypothetical protein n=1 Tax=Qipengyuania flava TaxID=192812 RepID=UPI001C637494|nr:hypothetical protein [Qipengyuania flava]QYJ08186.1 hypothetical protein KUV82_05670 [Qipengyuania flava]
MNGIADEMRPLVRMTAPDGVNDLRETFQPDGRPMFTSRFLALGKVPLGKTRLCFSELSEDLPSGRFGFVENSQMTGMRSWKHEREVSGDADTSTVTDRLAFDPLFAPGVAELAVARFFRHRHSRLKEMFG